MCVLSSFFAVAGLAKGVQSFIVPSSFYSSQNQVQFRRDALMIGDDSDRSRPLVKLAGPLGGRADLQRENYAFY